MSPRAGLPDWNRDFMTFRVVTAAKEAVCASPRWGCSPLPRDHPFGALVSHQVHKTQARLNQMKCEKKRGVPWHFSPGVLDMTWKKGAPGRLSIRLAGVWRSPGHIGWDQFPPCSVRGQCWITQPSLFLPTRKFSTVPHTYCSLGREHGDGWLLYQSSLNLSGGLGIWAHAPRNISVPVAVTVLWSCSGSAESFFQFRSLLPREIGCNCPLLPPESLLLCS